MTPTVTFNAVRALQRVFLQLADKGVLNLGASEEEHASGNKAAKHHTNGTVAVQFKSFMQALLDLLTHRHDQVKVCINQNEPPEEVHTWSLTIRDYVCADSRAESPDGAVAQEDNHLQCRAKR